MNPEASFASDHGAAIASKSNRQPAAQQSGLQGQNSRFAQHCTESGRDGNVNDRPWFSYQYMFRHAHWDNASLTLRPASNLLQSTGRLKPWLGFQATIGSILVRGRAGNPKKDSALPSPPVPPRPLTGGIPAQDGYPNGKPQSNVARTARERPSGSNPVTTGDMAAALKTPEPRLKGSSGGLRTRFGAHAVSRIRQLRQPLEPMPGPHAGTLDDVGQIWHHARVRQPGSQDWNPDSGKSEPGFG